MSLIEELKADTLTARKAKSPQAAVLRTVLGTIDTRSKQKGTTVDDTLALSVIKATLKGLQDTHQLLNKTGRTQDLEQTEIEIKTLEIYLPTLLGEDELTGIIETAIAGGKTNIGAIMGSLKATHSGQYDGKQASRIAKELLDKVT